MVVVEWASAQKLNEERWRKGTKKMITHGVRYVAGCIHFDNHTKHDAASNSDKAGNLPKVTIVKHFFAVRVQRPVVSFARVIFVARYLTGNI